MPKQLCGRQFIKETNDILCSVLFFIPVVLSSIIKDYVNDYQLYEDEESRKHLNAMQQVQINQSIFQLNCQHSVFNLDYQIMKANNFHLSVDKNLPIYGYTKSFTTDGSICHMFVTKFNNNFIHFVFHYNYSLYEYNHFYVLYEWNIGLGLFPKCLAEKDSLLVEMLEQLQYELD